MTPDQEVPRRLKVAIGGVYLGIVLLGSWVGAQAWLGAENAHYLASRKNLLNRVFAKRGWLWFTLAFWASYAGRRLRAPPLAAALRYAAATVWWVLFAQWFLGAPLMDRVFTVTGGVCERAAETAAADAHGAAAANKVVSSAVCRKSGGEWAGGHDPSGHVFLLVHSSLVLWMEIAPDLLDTRRRGAALSRGAKVALALLALWAVMLFLTSLYFHSTAEKVSGLAAGLFEAYFVYVRGETAAWGALFAVRAPPTAVAPDAWSTSEDKGVAASANAGASANANASALSGAAAGAGEAFSEDARMLSDVETEFKARAAERGPASAPDPAARR